MLQYRHILIIGCSVLAICVGAACVKFGKLKDKAEKKELSAHDIEGKEKAAEHTAKEPTEAVETNETEQLTAEAQGMGFFDKMKGNSREDVLSCAKFLGGIPSEAFVYHMQAKIKSYAPHEERGNYLVPHFKVRGVTPSQNLAAMNACADAIASIERFAEVKTLSKMTPDQTLSFLEEKQKLFEVVGERFPLRSCALVLGSVKTKKQFAKTRADLKEQPELAMNAKLLRYNTAGENYQNRTITVRGCLAVWQGFRHLDDLNKFNLSTSAEQFELLTQHAIPVQYAH